VASFQMLILQHLNDRYLLVAEQRLHQFSGYRHIPVTVLSANGGYSPFNFSTILIVFASVLAINYYTDKGTLTIRNKKKISPSFN